MLKTTKSTLSKATFTIWQAMKLAYGVRPKWFVLTALLNASWGLLDIPLLLVSKELIDVVVEAIKGEDWQQYVYPIAGLILAQAIFEFIRQFVSRMSETYNTMLTRRIDADVEIKVSEHHGRMDIPRVEDPEFRDKYDRITRESSRRLWGLIRPLFGLIQGLVGLISNLVIVATFIPVVVPIMLALAIPEAMVNARMTKRSYELRTRSSNKYRLWQWFLEYLSGGKNNYEVRIFNSSNVFVRKIKQMSNGVFNDWEELGFKRAYLSTAVSVFRVLFFAGFNFYLFMLALMQRITLGYAQMIFRAGNSFQNYLGQMIRSVMEIYENQLYIKDLMWFFDLKPEIDDGKSEADLNMKKGIEFKNVWFRYPSSKSWVLRNVSLKIKPGENVALVGENGVGKTTLIKLLCGFYHPQKGKILVNGKEIKEYRHESYLQFLSVLFQEFEQYPFSVRETIGYGDIRRLKEMDKIVEVAKATKVDEFIEKLPRKYRNPISKELKEGVEPSKGQWQRLALARALFKQAPILVLDEPTSNVDPKAEEAIFNDLIRLNEERIIVLISHRFSTVRRADKILVIDGGKVKEKGSHKELMKKKGVYAKLFEAQAKGYR